MTSMLKPPVSEHDHVAGSLQSPVVLVEYGDYECPHCGRAYPIIQLVQRTLGDRLAFVFRNFPLGEVHPHAVLAAEAAEAASAQGKFWEMHDTIYEHQRALELEDLLGYAKGLGLDTGQMERELENDTHTQKVHDDFHGGVRSGVNGTPTFFVNGTRFDGDWTDPTEFMSMLAQVAEHPNLVSTR